MKTKYSFELILLFLLFQTLFVQFFSFYLKQEMINLILTSIVFCFLLKIFFEKINFEKKECKEDNLIFENYLKTNQKINKINFESALIEEHLQNLSYKCYSKKNDENIMLNYIKNEQQQQPKFSVKLNEMHTNKKNFNEITKTSKIKSKIVSQQLCNDIVTVTANNHLNHPLLCSVKG